MSPFTSIPAGSEEYLVMNTTPSKSLKPFPPRGASVFPTLRVWVCILTCLETECPGSKGCLAASKPHLPRPQNCPSVSSWAPPPYAQAQTTSSKVTHHKDREREIQLSMPVLLGPQTGPTALLPNTAMSEPRQLLLTAQVITKRNMRKNKLSKVTKNLYSLHIAVQN